MTIIQSTSSATHTVRHIFITSAYSSGKKVIFKYCTFKAQWNVDCNTITWQSIVFIMQWHFTCIKRMHFYITRVSTHHNISRKAIIRTIRTLEKSISPWVPRGVREIKNQRTSWVAHLWRKKKRKLQQWNGVKCTWLQRPKKRKTFVFMLCSSGH